MELQQNLDAIKMQGLGVAALGNDSVGRLKSFADQQCITYRLSDSDSKIIRTFDILNRRNLRQWSCEVTEGARTIAPKFYRWVTTYFRQSTGEYRMFERLDRAIPRGRPGARYMKVTVVATPDVAGRTSRIERRSVPEHPSAIRRAVGVLAIAAWAIGACTAAAPGIPNTFASALAIDKANYTVTLPLFRGQVTGKGGVYFVLTESSDFNDAVARGINWSPKLKNALGTAAVQYAQVSDLPPGQSCFDAKEGIVQFSGTVDFSGQRLVVPGPNLFPLDPSSHAGPVGGSNYSPLFTACNGIVYNGSQVANNTGVHGKVISIDEAKRQVTLRLTAGFYEHRDVLYVSLDASVTQVAALENVTYAPNLNAAPIEGNDVPSVSAREPIIPVVNGATGVTNPNRQGRMSAVLGEGDPLNIIREEPECSDPSIPANCSVLEYSPLWDVHLVDWTQAAINAGLRHLLTSHEDVETLFQSGAIVSDTPSGPENQDRELLGLHASGVVINCPPMFVAP